MKFDVLLKVFPVSPVAPLVGAWIEIRWTKQRNHAAPVAPLVGAWIEISHGTGYGISLRVAPLVGAWIEILITGIVQAIPQRRSPRGSVD